MIDIFIFKGKIKTYISKKIDSLAEKIISLKEMKLDAYFSLSAEYFEGNLVYEKIEDIKLSYKIKEEEGKKPCLNILASHLPYSLNGKIFYDERVYPFLSVYVDSICLEILD